MEKLIEFALCGSYSHEYDPYAATEDVGTQRMLLSMNSEPLSLQEISLEINLSGEEAARRLKALRRCRLVKETKKAGKSRYQPSFAILSLKDQGKLRPLIEELGESLASIVEDFLPKVEEGLTKVKCIKQGYRFPDLAYITIGAYAFDYAGLEILEREGLVTSTKEMPGGNYVFSGLEAGLIDLRKEWMWGHNQKYGKYVFSTHGKLPPERARRAFPDLSMAWTRYAKKEGEEKCIKQKVARYGDLLYELLEGLASIDHLAKTLDRREVELTFDLTLLEELEYVTSTAEKEEQKYTLKYALNRPVLLPKDRKLIRELSEEILMQFLAPLKANYDELESLYGKTSPAKNNIDIREAIVIIYHLIFEKALNELITSETIVAPPLRRDSARYSAWVAMEEAPN